MNTYKRTGERGGVVVPFQLTPANANLPRHSVRPSVNAYARKTRARAALVFVAIAFAAACVVEVAGLLVTRATAQSQPPSQPAASGVAMVTPEGPARAWWRRWRGASGQGIAEGAGYPDAWSDTENVLWKSQVPGRGHSSPIVWQDRIFIT